MESRNLNLTGLYSGSNDGEIAAFVNFFQGKSHHDSIIARLSSSMISKLNLIIDDKKLQNFMIGYDDNEDTNKIGVNLLPTAYLLANPLKKITSLFKSLLTFCYIPDFYINLNKFYVDYEIILFKNYIKECLENFSGYTSIYGEIFKKILNNEVILFEDIEKAYNQVISIYSEFFSHASTFYKNSFSYELLFNLSDSLKKINGRLNGTYFGKEKLLISN